MASPLSSRETACLATLRSNAILDAPPEQQYDEVAALAAESAPRSPAFPPVTRCV